MSGDIDGCMQRNGHGLVYAVTRKKHIIRVQQASASFHSSKTIVSHIMSCYTINLKTRVKILSGNPRVPVG